MKTKFLPIFKVPKDYSDYTFWRSEHQRWAVAVMLYALVIFIFRLIWQV